MRNTESWRIDRVVGAAHRAAQRPVDTDQRIERIAEHCARAPRHVLDFRIRRDVRFHLDEAQRRLGDVHPVVADPLEIARDLDGGDNETKIARHRLLQRQQRDGRLLHLDLERIDRLVAGDHRLRLSRVALEQRLDGQLHEALRLLRHVDHRALQRIELIVKVAMPTIGTHPNLPVM
jgi:hypothetical protein